MYCSGSEQLGRLLVVATDELVVHLDQVLHCLVVLDHILRGFILYL